MTGWLWLLLIPLILAAALAIAGLRHDEDGHLAWGAPRMLAPHTGRHLHGAVPQLRGCIAEADPDGPAPAPASGAGPLARETRPQPVLDQAALVRPWSPENTWSAR